MYYMDFIIEIMGVFIAIMGVLFKHKGVKYRFFKSRNL